MTERAFEFANDDDIEIVKMTKESYDIFEEYNQDLVWSRYAASNERSAKNIELLKEENAKWLEDNLDDAKRLEEMLAD